MTVGSTVSKRTGRTASPQVRRQQLINATIESIAKRGFSETTLAHVTSGAKLSQGIVNFHFRSKELLFLETIGFLANEHITRWRETLDKSGASPQERLMALIDTDFHPKICTRKKLSVWFAFYGDTKYRAAYRQRCEKIDSERLAETQRLCELIKQEGGYDGVRSRQFANGLEAFIDGLWLNMLLYPKTFSRAEAKEQCMAYLVATFPKHFDLAGETGPGGVK